MTDTSCGAKALARVAFQRSQRADSPVLPHADAYQSDTAEYKEAFALFDKRGKGTISADLLGDLLRALGQNPTQADVAEIRERAPAESESRL